ncbi:cholinesterase [Biomphalaria glabrata]|nr:cholinesterase-like [Biomphalaria glabrata]
MSTHPASLPVMVWIHGGGFLVGFAAAFDGKSLAKKGVVVVSINYRLDAFGFLSTESEDIPGNYGLLDQIFALKWVKDNIDKFGGDKNQVTIFGESAGACSVSLLTVSERFSGLFHRAIMESGSSLAPWCVIYPSTSLRPELIVQRIGEKLNCSSKYASELLTCLQNSDAEKLLDASVYVQTEAKVNAILLPVVRNVFEELPRVLMNYGHINSVQTLRGYNSNEAGALKQNFTSGATRQEFKAFLNEKLAHFNILNKDSFIRQYENAYLGNISDPKRILEKSSEAVTDLYYTSPMLIELDKVVGVVSNIQHYLYEFNYRKSISSLPSWATAEHADEVPFILREFQFPLWLSPIPPTQDDLLVSEQMMTLWANFAKTGDPTSTLPTGAIKWPAYVRTNPRLLKINKVSTVTSPGRREGLNIYEKLISYLENENNVNIVIG